MCAPHLPGNAGKPRPIQPGASASTAICKNNSVVFASMLLVAVMLATVALSEVFAAGTLGIRPPRAPVQILMGIVLLRE